MSRYRIATIVIVAAIMAIVGYLLHSWMNPQIVYTSQDAPSGAVENWPELAHRFEKEKASVATIFDEATKVESFRVSSDDIDFATDAALLKAKKIKKEVGGFPVVSIGPILKQDSSKRLAEVLLDPKNYLAPGEDNKMCFLTPGVAFRVWKEKQFADVLICFACDQLLVVEQDPKVPLRSIGDHRARFRVGGDFDPVRPQLIELCKQVFVNDKEIQALSAISGGGTVRK